MFCLFPLKEYTIVFIYKLHLVWSSQLVFSNTVIFLGRIWVACTIFCKLKEEDGQKGYYTPRVEFNDFNSDPYFPDGTWCHNDGKQNYYCQQHKCLPKVIIFFFYHYRSLKDLCFILFIL